MDTSVETIDLRLREGDLESRVNDAGTLEVLVHLPSRPSAPREPAQFQSAAPAPLPSSQTLMPLLRKPKWDRIEDTRWARRSARVAWAVAAMMLVAAGTASLITASVVAGAREKSRDLSRKLEIISLAADDLTSQRDRLRGQLADTSEALTKAQGELVVERNVEDTLFKAVQAAHAQKATDPKSPQFADVGR
jgi:hypothetical protein